MKEELLYTMALIRTLPMNSPLQNVLVKELGSAKAVYENRKELKALLPDCSDHMVQTLARMDDHLSRAEHELVFAERNKIQCLLKSGEEYPVRLKDCNDAPLLLYYKGNAELNTQHVVSIVGTRHCSEYGRKCCHQMVEEWARQSPDILVVSGLAYGVDICSHREALENGLNTVAVLAHGLDQIYPRLHRSTALKMLEQGGLLTEYMSGTTAEKVNFVSRNRIVAGMADAIVVVESMAKGGSLITARIANDYNRDVFALPGRMGDETSEGCLHLIRDNKAILLASPEQLFTDMGWHTPARPKVIQRQLFPELTAEEQHVVDYLKTCDEGMDLGQMTVGTNIGINRLTSILFELELKGVVTLVHGAHYRLL